MDGREGEGGQTGSHSRQLNGQSSRPQGDVILFQRISGGWEYRYSHDGETYRGFHHDPVFARTHLLRQLGWERWRFERAQFRRF